MTSSLLLALDGLLLVVVYIEVVLVDVFDNLVGNVVADALAALAEKPDLSGRDIVLDQLWDDTDVVSVLLKSEEGVICVKSVLVMCACGIVHGTYRCRCHCARG